MSSEEVKEDVNSSRECACCAGDETPAAAPEKENEENSATCSCGCSVENNEKESVDACANEASEEKVPCSDNACDASCSCSADGEEKNEKAARPAKPERPRVEVTDKMLEDTAKTLSVMLEHLKLEADVKVEKSHNSSITLLVSSTDAGRIIGKKGQTLESLQFLVNRMMQKDDQDYPRIFIDIDGYSTGSSKRDRRGGERRDRRGSSSDRPQRRESNGGDEDFERSPNADVLRQQAIDAAKEVRRWGESVTLPPMNARDRRIIHITLESETDLTTDSEGEGAKKRVVIALKK